MNSGHPGRVQRQRPRQQFPAGGGFRGYDFGGRELPEGRIERLEQLGQFFKRIDETTWIAVALAIVGVILVLSLLFLVLGVFDAFRKAWEIVRAKLGPLIIMALILILGGGILSFILGMPFIGIVVPAVLAFALGTETSIYSGLAITGLCLAAAIPLFIVLSGVLTTYTTGAWTLTYRRLIGKAGVAAPAA